MNLEAKLKRRCANIGHDPYETRDGRLKCGTCGEDTGTVNGPVTTGSQKSQVLAALHAGPVCSFTFYDNPKLTHRLAARIYDLRTDGLSVYTRPCANPQHHHESRAVEYYI